MPTLNRSQLSDLRGGVRMAVDATDVITEIVEELHRTIQLRPGPLGGLTSDRPKRIAGTVYRTVRVATRLIGKAIDVGLAPVTELLPEGHSSPSLDAYRSVANGVYGDYLLRTGNPLAIEMSLRYRGQPVDLQDPMSIFEEHGDARSASKVLVLVHGLCMNDRQWNRDGHDHGAALASELGYLPLYLRYNSGLHIASNGRALAEMLETLVDNCSSPVEELAIMGHSMGGLVARSACHHGAAAGHKWPEYLRKLVFLGTPHHGAPLERGGYGLELAMELSPYLAPFTHLSRARSAGITDLRHGAVAAEQEFVPLPPGVQCFTVAAVRAAKRSMLSDRLIGDGLVPLDSALGRHRDTARRLAIPKHRQWIGYRMGHRDLLNHPEVYKQVSTWLQEV